MKKSSGTFNKITLDNEGVVLPHDLDGNPVNPHTLNNVSTQYIIFDTDSASVDKILARTTVYQQRTTAKNLHNLAYDIYKKSIIIHLFQNVLINMIYLFVEEIKFGVIFNRQNGLLKKI